MRLILLAVTIMFQMALKAQPNHAELPVIKNIPEILVKPTLGVMRISRDTIEYKVGNTLSPEIVKLEDLFRNFLGFHITDNGRIFYNGKEVSFLLIDGDPVSISDYNIISQHLNANMFSSIEVIQQYQSNRFIGVSPTKNELAINLRMKKEFRGRFNTDLTVQVASPKGLYGMIDANRIGGQVKLIAVVEKNIYGNRWEMRSTSIVNNQEYKVPLISLLQHPFLLQTNLFKQSYLFNNVGNHIKMLHAFKLSSYATFRVEAGKEKVYLDFNEHQQNNYFIGADNILNEKRNSKLNLSNENSYMKLMFDHDRLKNNRGEYKLYINYQALTQQLQDSIERGMKRFNYSWDDQRRKLVMFQGLEKYLIGKMYLLEVGFQCGINNLYRLMQQNDIEKNEFEILQQYLSTEIRLSFQKFKHSFHIGHRFVKEQREISTQFLKQYVFVEHQFRLNKKMFFNTDLSVGNGEISSKGNQTAKSIFLLEGEMIFKKSMFNHAYLKYFVSQRIPTIEAWMANPLLQLSGYIQYQYLPDRFSLIKNVELGKSYQHLFRGFGFNYSVIANYVKNDAFHSIGFDSFNIVDTIRYGNNSRNIQYRAEADQFIFPVKIRVSTSFQFTSARMIQGIMGQSTPMLLNLQSIRLACKSSWEKSFQWEYSGSFQRNQTKAGGKGANVNFFIHQLNAKYKLGRKFYTAVQTNYIDYQQQKNYMFLDVLLQFRSSEKSSLNISMMNASNVQSFEQSFVSGYGVQSISTPLAGRKFQIEFRRSF
jgi:hypothetical protein